MNERTLTLVLVPVIFLLGLACTFLANVGYEFLAMALAIVGPIVIYSIIYRKELLPLFFKKT